MAYHIRIDFGQYSQNALGVVTSIRADSLVDVVTRDSEGLGRIHHSKGLTRRARPSPNWRNFDR